MRVSVAAAAAAIRLLLLRLLRPPPPPPLPPPLPLPLPPAAQYNRLVLRFANIVSCLVHALLSVAMQHVEEHGDWVSWRDQTTTVGMVMTCTPGKKKMTFLVHCL
jgi:hypothetical protein